MMSKASEDGQGRGVPEGWGWADEGHRSLLYAPGKGGPDYNAIAYLDGTFGAYESHEGLSLIASAMGDGPPSPERMAAAQREAEAALWRCDGFGVGEVRGARMMLGQQPTIVGADRLFCLMDLPGLWRVIRVPLNSEAIVEVDAVRAPVAPIRIAVGAPDPLGLGVGEHDAPGGGPCSCGAWHREAAAEPAPLPLAAMTGCDSHSVDPRAGCAECNAIAAREEPSFRTGCAEHLRIWGRGCEACDLLRAGGEPAPLPPKPWREQTDAEQVNATKARARELGFVIRDPRDRRAAPREPSAPLFSLGLLGDAGAEILRAADGADPPAPTDDPGDELARLLPGLPADVARLRGWAEDVASDGGEVARIASAIGLLLGERERAVSAAESQIVREREGLVDYMHEWHRLDYEAHPGLSTEEIAVEVMRGLRARVAELEAERADLLTRVEEAVSCVVHDEDAARIIREAMTATPKGPSK